MDVSSDEVKLLNQSVVNGVDIYPPRDDSPTLIGNDAAPIVDGFQIYLNINYAAPLTFFDFKLNGESIPCVEKAPGVPAQRWTNDFWSFTDFTYFGDLTGTYNEAYGYGSLSIDTLQQDYEYRWTGVQGDTV